MKKLKIVAVILLLSLSVILLCGCGESFTYRYVVNTTGGFSKEYILQYDPQADDADLVKEKAVAAMKSYAENAGYGEYASVDAETAGQVALKIAFPTAEDYAIWSDQTGREANEVRKTEKEGLFVYADDELDNYLTEENVEAVRSLLSSDVRDFPLNGKFYFVYGTPYRSVKSNGVVTKEDGIYYHTWEVQPDRDEDILIRRYGLNGILLYSLVLSIFVLSLIVIFVIIYIEKKKSRKKYARFAESAAAHMDSAGVKPDADKE